MDLPPLDLGQLVGQSQLRPGVLMVTTALAVAYLLRSVRVPGWPVGRTVSFLAGLAVIVVATGSGIEAYGHVLEWMHMIEHLMLIMVAPVLLAIGSPLQLVPGLRPVLARPVLSWLTSPAAAAILYAIAVVGVHLTDFMDRAMTDTGAHTGEELAYLVSGYLLFQLVFGRWPGPWQLSGAGRMALLALVTPVDTIVGVVLLQTGTVEGGVGTTHDHPRPDWALSAASDTVAAGTTMWIGGTGVMAALMLAVGLVWLHGRPPVQTGPSWTERARQSVHAERTGQAEGADLDDDDAALAAYNTWLARMHERDG